MKDQFVTYEITKKLNELGFNEFRVFGYYNQITHSGKWVLDDHIYDGNGDYLNAPLWQQTIDWLRIHHDIEFKLEPTIGDKHDIFVFNGAGWKFLLSTKYEQAREAAILKALELIK